MADSSTVAPAVNELSSTLTTARIHAAKIAPPEGVTFLLVIIYGVTIVLLGVVFVKRLVQRIAPKFSKGFSDASKHAPKALKADIDKRLMQTLHVVYEPKLLLEDDKRCRLLSTGKDQLPDDRTEPPCNYLYRMKAVDDMKKLESALCRIDEGLKRPPIKDLKQHLRDAKSHSSGVMKNVRSSQMKIVIDMYEHARYKLENFGKREYGKFSEALNEVLISIEQKSKKKRGKKQQSQRNSNNSSAEVLALRRVVERTSEKEPLIGETSKKTQ